MRLENDRYYTPSAQLTKVLLDNVKITGSVLEPCCGQKDISFVLEKENLNVISTDLDMGAQYDANFQTYWDSILHPIDWVITNPPYIQPTCQNIIEKAFEKAQIGIAMLLRLTYLEPCSNRSQFLQNYPLSDLLILNPRPKFRADKKGSDNTTVAWFVWKKTNSDHTNIKYITKWNK